MASVTFFKAISIHPDSPFLCERTRHGENCALVHKEDVIKQDLKNGWTKYIVDDTIELYFSNKNRKLFKINTLIGYKGRLLDKIYVGMSKDELLASEDSLIYNDFEEVYESAKGFFVETDLVEEIVIYITIYIPEMDQEDFDDLEW